MCFFNSAQGLAVLKHRVRAFGPVSQRGRVLSVLVKYPSSLFFERGDAFGAQKRLDLGQDSLEQLGFFGQKGRTGLTLNTTRSFASV